MSGVLEQVLDELKAIRQLLAAGASTGGGTSALPGAGAAAPLTPPPSNVTQDALMALIQPHVGNETIKAALGAAMRGMGINGLPEVQPHQLQPLYETFQRVIAQHTGGGGAAPPAQTSII